MSEDRKDDAQDQRENNGKIPGGITGKGFQPGQSGNPGGRPKGRTVVAEMMDIIEEDEERIGLARACIQKAKDGSFPHLQEILQRQSGKVADKMEAEIREGEPLRGVVKVNAIIAQAVKRRAGSNGHAVPLSPGGTRLNGE